MAIVFQRVVQPQRGYAVCVAYIRTRRLAAAFRAGSVFYRRRKRNLLRAAYARQPLLRANVSVPKRNGCFCLPFAAMFIHIGKAHRERVSVCRVRRVYSQLRPAFNQVTHYIKIIRLLCAHRRKRGYCIALEFVVLLRISRKSLSSPSLRLSPNAAAAVSSARLMAISGSVKPQRIKSSSSFEFCH